MTKHSASKESQISQTTVKGQLNIETPEDQLTLHESSTSQKIVVTSVERSNLFKTQTPSETVEKITLVIDNERDYYDAETESTDLNGTSEKVTNEVTSVGQTSVSNNNLTVVDKEQSTITDFLRLETSEGQNSLHESLTTQTIVETTIEHSSWFEGETVSDTVELENRQQTSENYFASYSEKEGIVVSQSTSTENSSETIALETNEPEYFSKIFITNNPEGDENMEMRVSLKALPVDEEATEALMRSINMVAGK